MAATYVLALKRHTENPSLPEEIDMQLDGPRSVSGISYTDFLSYQQMRRGLRYSTTFLPVFTGSLSPRPSPVDGLQDGDQRGKAPPTVREEPGL